MSVKNIVASATATSSIDLQKIVDSLPLFSERNHSFGSLSIKFDASSLCQLFRNGKIIVIGGTTESGAKAIFDSYMKDLADLGYPINYKIQNVMACYKHPLPVSLENIAKTFGLEYNPELFPAVRYRDNDRKVTANIFRQGSEGYRQHWCYRGKAEGNTMQKIKADTRFRSPFGCMVCGPSMSGKSNFIMQLIRKDLFNPRPDWIVYAYWSLQDEFTKAHGVEFVSGVDGLKEVNLSPGLITI